MDLIIGLKLALLLLVFEHFKSNHLDYFN